MNKVKRFILTIAMCLFVTCAFAAAPVQVSYINETTGVAVPVSTVHPMPVNVLTMPDISVSPDTRFTFFGKYLEVVQKDTGINDGGGSITVDGTVTATNTVMVADSLTQDTVSFTPYAESSKTYTNVKAIEIYNAGKAVRWANVSGGCATGKGYWLIPASSPGYTKDGLNFSTVTIYFMGDGTTADTGTAQLNIWK